MTDDLVHRNVLGLPASVMLNLPLEVIDRLREFGIAAGKGGLAPRTLKAMRSDGRIFATWCDAERQSWLPATPRTVALFVEAMATAGKAPATVQRYLASIALWHRAAELAVPTSSLGVRMARKAHVRAVGSRQRQAEPLGSADIRSMLAVLADEIDDRNAMTRLTALRDRALLLVAHDTLARASELVSMRWEDLAVDQEGDGRILIRRSKTDQEGRGVQRWLDGVTVEALTEWRVAHDAALAIRQDGEADRLAALRDKRFPKQRARWPQGRKRRNPIIEPTRLEWIASPYIFRGLAAHTAAPAANQSNRAPARGERLGWSLQLSTSAVSRIIKRRLIAIGIDPAGYSAHSTRVGKVQDLLADGVDLFGAMDAGGWATPAMPARYGERILAGRGAVAQQHKRRRQGGGV